VLVDADDERNPGDESEWFPREPGSAKSGRDYGEDRHEERWACEVTKGTPLKL
jgi:hypothetical protein